MLKIVHNPGGKAVNVLLIMVTHIKHFMIVIVKYCQSFISNWNSVLNMASFYILV